MIVKRVKMMMTTRFVKVVVAVKNVAIAPIQIAIVTLVLIGAI